MDPPNLVSWNLTVRCAGCGAELTVEPDRRFIDCEYCHATSVFDLGGQATCYRLRALLDEEGASAKLRSWLRQRGLGEAEEEVTFASAVLVPFWTFGDGGQQRSLLAMDQANLPLEPTMDQPAGQLEHFESEPTATLLEPTVPLPAALERLEARGEAPPADAREMSLVYAPFLWFEYSYGGVPFQALVDAAGGAIHATAWPRPRDQRLDRALGLRLAIALVAYTTVAAVVPGLLWALLALAALSLPLWWMLVSLVERSEAS